jgi:hypothetical protein
LIDVGFGFAKSFGLTNKKDIGKEMEEENKIITSYLQMEY